MKNRTANNNKMRTLRKPTPVSCFMILIMKVFEEESTEEFPAMLVILALSIRTS